MQIYDIVMTYADADYNPDETVIDNFLSEDKANEVCKKLNDACIGMSYGWGWVGYFEVRRNEVTDEPKLETIKRIQRGLTEPKKFAENPDFDYTDI